MTKQRLLLKIGLVVAVLASFVLASALTENVLAAGPNRSPTPTPMPSLTPTPTTAPTQLPSVTPTANATFTPVHPAIQVSKFGYEAVGKENSSLPAPYTYTLCNFTTPSQSGTIIQISIYLRGIQAHVKAVIFANEPQANFPEGGAPVAQSSDTLNITSLSGQWYNFSMNYPASKNTIYWLGYYSDGVTNYFYDSGSNSISVTSQPNDNSSKWLPVNWSFKGKSTMSLYGLYAFDASAPSPTPTQINSSVQSGFQDTVFVLLVIVGESVIVVTHQLREKKLGLAKDRFTLGSTGRNMSGSKGRVIKFPQDTSYGNELKSAK